MKKVNRELLEAVARTKPVLPHTGRGKKHADNGGGFDVAEFIARHDIEVVREGSWNKNDHRWILAECPWNSHTDNAAYIVQFSNGAIAAGCHHDSCQGYGWRDFKEHYEPGTYDYDEVDTEAVASDNHATPQAQSNVHAAPHAQPAVQLPDVPPLPLDALPPSLKELVEETAKAVVCPPEFIAVPMLATLGAAIGNSYVIRVKRGWEEGATVFSMVIADPGAKKSPPFKEATKSAWKRQAKLKREYDEEMQEYQREKSRWEVEKKKAKEEDRPAPPPPEEPIMGRVVVDDPTVEALIDRLEENPRGILLGRDELAAWVKAMDQYKGGKGSDRQFYLSVWSNSPTAVDRPVTT